MSQLTGKVAAVLSKRQVVINRGRRNGVTPGMKFLIRMTVGPIRDPDDPSNVLESISLYKATVTARTVFEGMTICNIEPRLTSGLTTLSFGEPREVYRDVEDPLISDDALNIRAGDIVEEAPPPPPSPPAKKATQQ